MDRRRTGSLCGDFRNRSDRHPVTPESGCEGCPCDRFDRFKGDRDPDAYSDTDSDGNADSYCDACAYGNPDPHSDTDSDTDGDTDPDGNACAYGGAHSDSDRGADTGTYRGADPGADA